MTVDLTMDDVALIVGRLFMENEALKRAIAALTKPPPPVSENANG